MRDPLPESLGRLPGMRRRAVSVSPESLVRVEPLRPNGRLPLAVRPAVDGLDLGIWAAGHREFVESELRSCGGLVFRGFGLRSTAEMEGVVRALYGELLAYTDRVQPRKQVGTGSQIYSSTQYPPDQTIELHNESSYAYSWPLRIFFFCMTPSPVGGETPLADCRGIFARIRPEVRERLLERRVMYVRNFGDGLGITWQTAFQTEDRTAMEGFCRAKGIELEWRGRDRLRTRSVRPVALSHPRTGERVWFNALISSHSSTLDPAVRQTLLSEYAEDELPKNSFYGDGAPFEPETLAEIRRACREETTAFPWEEGDLLLLDNMLVAHGRTPYQGPRKVVVAMAEPVNLGNLSLLIAPERGA
jgi:alpha-ketoglutarate-dependent taurine dioxygenase